jgi:hypothetical protein
MNLLQIEKRWTEREMRTASGAEIARLARARQVLKHELDELMGQTV